MIDAREPKDGDFVAYVDRLEREFAARNLSSIAADAAATAAPHLKVQARPGRDPFQDAIETRSVGRANLPNPVRLLAGAAACAIGLVVLLVWFFSAGLRWILFLIGVALIAWGGGQLVQAFAPATASADTDGRAAGARLAPTRNIGAARRP